MNKASFFNKKLLVVSLLGFFLACLQDQVLAQDTSKEALIARLGRLEDNTEKVNTLNQLAEYYLGKQNQEAVKQAKKALKLSTGLNYLPGLAEAYTLLGNFEGVYNNRPDRAADYHKNAFDIYYQLSQQKTLPQEELYQFVLNNVSPIYALISDENYRQRRKDKKAIRKYQALYSELTQYLLDEKLIPEKEVVEQDNDTPNTPAQNITPVKTLRVRPYVSPIEHEMPWDEDLGETSILLAEKLNIQEKYIEALENKLDENGVDYKKIKSAYNMEVNRIKDRINDLNLIILQKDSLARRDALIHAQKIRIAQSEKLTLASARRLDELKYRRNILIACILGAILLIITFVFYKYARIRERQKEQIELKNQQLEKQNQDITAQSQEIEQTIVALNQSYRKITDSLKYAEKIQTAILPRPQAIEAAFSDAFLIFMPRDIVSGDFYWMSRLEEKTFIAVVDCTGHGVPGAFMSMIGNTLLNKIIREEKILNPAHILERLDQEVRTSLNQEDTDNNDGMDVGLCRLEELPNGLTLVTFAGSKQDLYYFKDDSSPLDIVKGDRKRIGGYRAQGQVFQSHQVILEKGGAFYLITDGFLDQNNRERKKLGKKQIIGRLASNRHQSMQEQKEKLIELLEIHQQNEPQRDDVTMLGIKI